jgi:5-methylcytosine-specific restriction endonuclease McrA
METTSDLPPSDERAIAVRLRDNDSCTICRRTSAETNLEVHSIIPGDGDVQDRLSNYVLLCEDHHRAAHQPEAGAAW